MVKIFANFRSPDSDPLFNHLKNKYADKSFTFWYDKFPDNTDQLKINSYNFLFLHEPNEFFGMANFAITQQSHFTSILSWDQNLLDNCFNGVKFTYNGRTLDYNYINQINDQQKTFQTSFLCGTKNLVEGHRLRHRVYKLESQIQTPKKWYYTLEDYDHKTDTRPGYAEYSKDLSHIPEGVDVIGYGKRVLFDNSMFNVVIENVNSLNWYNKIGDNFLSKTIPIYWGCPNIDEFGYDSRGIIKFNNEEELLNILNNLTPEMYVDMKPYIDYNYEVAKLDEINNRIDEFFDNFFEINNVI